MYYLPNIFHWPFMNAFVCSYKSRSMRYDEICCHFANILKSMVWIKRNSVLYRPWILLPVAFHIIVHCMPSYTYVCIYRQRVLCGTICIGELNMPQATKLSWNIASPSSMYLAYCKLVKIVKELLAMEDNPLDLFLQQIKIHALFLC